MKKALRNISFFNVRPMQKAAVLFGLFALLAFFALGCATVGKDFSADKVSDIKIGKTTQDDIRTMFGTPWRTGMEDGQRTWTYGKYKYGILGEKKAKDLLIRFDENDVVASYTFSNTDQNE